MSEILTPIIAQLGIGGIGGFFVGYLIKKALKFVLIIGAFAFVASYFAYETAIEVNYAQLLARAQEFVTPAWGFLSPLLSKIPFSGSLILGVIIGFMMS